MGWLEFAALVLGITLVGIFLLFAWVAYLKYAYEDDDE